MTHSNTNFWIRGGDLLKWSARLRCRRNRVLTIRQFAVGFLTVFVVRRVSVAAVVGVVLAGRAGLTIGVVPVDS